MSTGLYSGVSALALGVGLYAGNPGLWGGAPGLITGDGASLYLNFLAGAPLDSRVTFTRASTATVTNSSGVIQSSAINDPRFDYDPVTLAAKGLLIEGQRTNLLTYSSDFTDIAWTKSYSAMAGTFTTAPDGTNTGAKWNELSTPIAEHQIYKTSSLTADLYTETWYLKAAERTRVRVSLATAGLVLGASVIADLSAGTLSAVTNLGGHTGGTATISSAGNSWYRVSLTITATVAVYYSALTMVTGTSTVYYIGDDTSGIFIWGAQLETGAFATSYIPTVASQVTRNTDVATMTGTNFSSWYNQSEGTFVVEGATISGGNVYRALAVARAAVGITDRVDISIGTGRSGGAGGFRDTIAVGGVVQAELGDLIAFAAETPYKHAFAYKANDFASATSGANLVTDASGTVPTVALLDIGNRNGAHQINGWVRSIAYYNTRLPNATLQALTA